MMCGAAGCSRYRSGAMQLWWGRGRLVCLRLRRLAGAPLSRAQVCRAGDRTHDPLRLVMHWCTGVHARLRFPPPSRLQSSPSLPPYPTPPLLRALVDWRRPVEAVSGGASGGRHPLCLAGRIVYRREFSWLAKPRDGPFLIAGASVEMVAYPSRGGGGGSGAPCEVSRVGVRGPLCGDCSWSRRGAPSRACGGGG